MHPHIFNPGNHNHEMAAANHIQPMGTTSHTQHVEAGRHYSQPTGYTPGGFSRVQDSGHQSLVTTPARPLCVVGMNHFVSNLTFLRRSRNGRFAMRTINTPPRKLRKPRPTARTSVRTRPRLRLKEHSEALYFTCTLGECRLTLFAETCSYPKCTYLAVMYPKDHRWNYCSESHERYVLMFDLPIFPHSKFCPVSRGADVSIVAKPLETVSSFVKDVMKRSSGAPRPSSLYQWITMRSGMVRSIPFPARA